MEDFFNEQQLSFLRFCAENRFAQTLKNKLSLQLVTNLRLMDDDGALDNPYELLGLTKNCHIEEIKERRKFLTFLCHPDKNRDPRSSEIMAKVQGAYEKIVEGRRKRKK